MLLSICNCSNFKVSPDVFQIYLLKLGNGSFRDPTLPCLTPRSEKLVRISGWKLPSEEGWGYHGENCMIITSNAFDWSTCVTDRRTDRRTISERYAISCRARWRSATSKLHNLTITDGHIHQRLNKQEAMLSLRYDRTAPQHFWGHVTSSVTSPFDTP